MVQLVKVSVRGSSMALDLFRPDRHRFEFSIQYFFLVPLSLLTLLFLYTTNSYLDWPMVVGGVPNK